MNNTYESSLNSFGQYATFAYVTSSITGVSVAAITLASTSAYISYSVYNNREIIAADCKKTYECLQWYGSCLASFGKSAYKLASTTYEYTKAGLEYIANKCSDSSEHESENDTEDVYMDANENLSIENNDNEPTSSLSSDVNTERVLEPTRAAA